jgi:hypothetical protein
MKEGAGRGEWFAVRSVFSSARLKRWTMTARRESVAEKLRIGVDEVKARLQSGEPITILDVRNDPDWEATPVKIAGAIRIRPADWHIDATWPKGQLAVVY